MDGSGNTNNLSQYSYTDNNLVLDTYYYRLQQVDFDGTATYSNVVTVNFNNGFTVSLFPNPFTDESNILITGNKGTGQIKIMNIAGSVVYIKEVNSESEVLTVGKELSDGVYIVQVISDGEVKNIRLVKNK